MGLSDIQDCAGDQASRSAIVEMSSRLINFKRRCDTHRKQRDRYRRQESFYKTGKTQIPNSTLVESMGIPQKATPEAIR